LRRVAPQVLRVKIKRRQYRKLNVQFWFENIEYAKRSPLLECVIVVEDIRDSSEAISDPVSLIPSLKTFPQDNS